jgi:hypothetical protein
MDFTFITRIVSHVLRKTSYHRICVIVVYRLYDDSPYYTIAYSPLHIAGHFLTSLDC